MDWIEKMVFWDVTPYFLVSGYQYFGGTFYLYIEGIIVIYPEVGGSGFLQNNGTYVPNYTASQPRTP